MNSQIEDINDLRADIAALDRVRARLNDRLNQLVATNQIVNSANFLDPPHQAYPSGVVLSLFCRSNRSIMPPDPSSA